MFGLCSETIRSFDIAESGTLHLDCSVAHFCCVDNLLSNVFSLSITIGPYHQQTGIFGLICYILGNIFFVLIKMINKISHCTVLPLTHIMNIRHNRCSEE
jgi:hypothetical protein